MKLRNLAILVIGGIAISCSSVTKATISDICAITNQICVVEGTLCGLAPKLATAKTVQDSTTIIAQQDSIKLVLSDLAGQLKEAVK